MTLTAMIRQKPVDGAKTVDDLESRKIVGTGETYDEAKADLETQVPDDWQLLYII